MATDQIKLVITGRNETGRMFREVSDDLKRVRTEAARPISGNTFGPTKAPRFNAVDESLRLRLAGQTRGLRKAADAHEANVTMRQSTGLDALSSAGLIR